MSSLHNIWLPKLERQRNSNNYILLAQTPSLTCPWKSPSILPHLSTENVGALSLKTLLVHLFLHVLPSSPRATHSTWCLPGTPTTAEVWSPPSRGHGQPESPGCRQQWRSGESKAASATHPSGRIAQEKQTRSNIYNLQNARHSLLCFICIISFTSSQNP